MVRRSPLLPIATVMALRAAASAEGLAARPGAEEDLSAEGHGGKVVLHVAPPADVGAVAAVDCDGSATRPFRSVAAARDALRSLQPLPHGGALVLLHEGMHAPFVLQGSIDSGRPEAPIVYAAAPGEHAMVSGARPIPPSAFKRWGGGSGLLRADLAPLGFTKSDLGGMQYPASDGTMSFGSCQHDKAELFWGGDAMTLARFPNKAADGTWQFLHADLAGTPGGTWFLMKDGPNATKIQKWCAVPDSNLGHQLPTISNSSGVPVLNSGHRRAAGEKNAWLHGYWEFDWADSYRKLDKVVPVTIPGPPPPPFPAPGHKPAPPCSSKPRPCNPEYHPGCPGCTWCSSNHTPGQCTNNVSFSNCPPCPNETHYTNVSFVPDTGNPSAGLQIVKRNARFYGVNILSELDQPGEYFIDEEALHIYFWPGGTISEKPLLLSVNSSAVITMTNGTNHVQLVDLEVGFGRGVGIDAQVVSQVLIKNTTVHGVGTMGINLMATDSTIEDSEVFHTGCAGVAADGGQSRPLVPGNITVKGNHIHHIANWKRTYMAAIHFGGSGNIYADNTVGFAPHTCMTGGGVNQSFTGNILDTCCLESSDVGAFYVCGQGGTAFWKGRGGIVKNNTFRNIRNIDGTGVQGPSVQALYLDDQMSGWEITQNRFINCMAGSFIGGGRDNHIHSNYYENCDLAQHIDSRGMGWEQMLCNCTNGSLCDPAVASSIVNDPRMSNYVAAYPQIKTAVLGGTHICVPVNNVIENNKFCNCKKYIDATDAQITSWHSTVQNNVEVHTCKSPLELTIKTDDEPNPPVWPSAVHIFSPDDDRANMNATIFALYANQDLYQDQHAAFLFKPGRYEIDVPVGYYTTVHGLGSSPSDVIFAGQNGVHQAESGPNLIKFWRGAENFVNSPVSGKMVWSVSQAAPLRRLIVEGDLELGTATNTQGSGGYISGVKLSGMLNFTMQQQWIARNCNIGKRGVSYFANPPRSVNFVYVGTTGSPPSTTECTNSGTEAISPSPQQLVEEHTPVVVEKPFITIDSHGKYYLVTPRASFNTTGPQWAMDEDHVYMDGFDKVFVASNETSVNKINTKLRQGLHVILTPGVYYLNEPIRIGRPQSSHQVLLGLGLATLVPLRGKAAVEVLDVPGVRVAGLLLQAGPVTSKALISVGSTVSDRNGESSHRENPILLADVFARVGGPGVDPETGLGPPVSATVMMEINSSHVVLDNVWLWRADVRNAHRSRDCNHSLVVNGHSVKAYGLAAEHVQSDNIVWNGESGSVYFYQAELDGLAHMPGDKTPDFGPNGVSGYRVNALEHHAVGVGVYCWFSSPGIIVQSGVKVRHEETLSSIVCPFKWVWENANTPPVGNSTIEKAILVVDGA